MRRFPFAVAIVALLGTVFGAGRPALAQASVTRATLGNGLQIIVVRDPLAPVVSAVLNYKVGGDEQSYPGQAHALEHMMFRGSATVSESQLADISELLGGNLDADTQPEITQYFFTAPSQYLDLVLRLEASRARGLTVSEKDWSIERGAIKNEVTQDESQPDAKLSLQMESKIFDGTPYSHDVLGTLHSFDTQIHSKQLLALYNAYYHPNNAIYVIAGNIDPAATIAEVKKYFGGIPSAPLPKRQPLALAPLVSQTFTVDSDRPNTLVDLVYRFPGYRDKDYAAGQILEAVLSNQRSNLYALVANGTALEAVFGDFETHPEAGAAEAEISVPVTMKPEDAIAALRGVLDAYRRDGVPADLVEAEKRRAIAQAEFKANSVEGLAFQWSQAVAAQGFATPDAYLTDIAKVTPDDVDRVLRKYVDPAHELVGIAAPAASAASSGAKAPVAAAAGGENSPTIIHHDPLPQWAKAAFAHVAVPAPASTPIDTKLSNGVRLIVVPQTVSQTIDVQGSIASNEGLETPAGLDGVGTITANMLPFGTAAYDRLALRTKLDEITADVTAGTHFSLSARSADFDRGVELLAQEELHPAFPAPAFDAVKAQELGSVRGVVTSPDHKTAVALNAALYPASDPAQRFASPDTVSKITLEDVKAYYASVYRPDLATIVVVGNVDPNHAKAVFEKEFGGWKASGPAPAVDPPAVPNNASADVHVGDPQKTQSIVQLVQVAPYTHLDASYAAFAVANAALGAGGSSILFHDVRDVHGLAYSVGSRLTTQKNRSVFAIRYACDPGKILAAQALIEADLKSLARDGLTASDLLFGRTELVSRIPLGEASFDGIANQLINYARLGLPLDQSTIDARSESAVTNADVERAVAKWIRQDGFVHVIEGPGP